MPGIVNTQMNRGAATGMPPKPALPAKPALGDPTVARIEIAAKKALAQPQIAQQIVQMIKATADPVQGVAQATTTLLRQLFTQSKGTMPQAAIMPAAQRIVVDVARVGAGAKLYKLTPDFIKQAAAALFQIMQQAFKTKQAQQQQQQQPAAQPAPQPAAQPAPPMPAPAAAAPMGA